MKNKYRIKKTKRYKRDLKRLCSCGLYDISKLNKTIDMLASGATLPEVYRNHRLKGELKQYEECHIKDDWVLIYRRHNEVLVLILARTGTHSNVFRK